jgi:hypothetical protein
MKGFHFMSLLADGMAYYSCHDLYLFGGPRGIRTLDLLNAIETRSQLRYGPLFIYSLSSGPEGIRTPDLLSAIETRSQLRYRPNLKVQAILPEANLHVKEMVYHAHERE